MYKAQSPKPSGSPKAVSFFKHFPTNFLRPYGLADNAPSEETIFRRLAPLNCEWLLRPRVAASEFADTMTQNLNYLSANSKSTLINNETFKEMKDNLTPFLASLEALNTQNDKGPAKATDVKQLMKTLLSDDKDMNLFFENIVKIGGAMFLLGTHYSVVKSLFSNPDWYAGNAVGTSTQVAQFKQDPTIKGLKQFLTATCCSTKEQAASTSEEGTNPAKRNLAALLDSSSEEEEIPPPKKRKKSTGKQRKEVENPPEQQSTSKKGKSKRQK